MVLDNFLVALVAHVFPDLLSEEKILKAICVRKIKLIDDAIWQVVPSYSLAMLNITS